jgi:hypothetical protein
VKLVGEPRGEQASGKLSAALNQHGYDPVHRQLAERYRHVDAAFSRVRNAKHRAPGV